MSVLCWSCVPSRMETSVLLYLAILCSSSIAPTLFLHCHSHSPSSSPQPQPIYCVYPPPLPPPAITVTPHPPPPPPSITVTPHPPPAAPAAPKYRYGPPQFVPGPPVFQPPVVYPPPSVPPPSSSSSTSNYNLWCVVKPSVPDPIIQEAMNYACGSGADCDSIQPNGSCYQPDTLIAHASFAFNSYWQRTKVVGGTCDFGGTAMLVTMDPSFDGCQFQRT